MNTKLIVTVIVVTIVALVIWLARDSISIARIAEQESLLRRWIQERPLQSWLLGLLIYYLTALIPGTGGKAIVYGWLFGVLWGVVLIETALTLAAITTYYFSRYLFRDAIVSRWPAQVDQLDSAVRTDGAFYLLTLRMLHVPITLVNYLSGASGIPMKMFVWTTVVGLLPGTLVFAFLGTQLPTLEQLAQDGVHSLVEPWLMVALVATGVIPALVRVILRRFRSAGGRRNCDLGGLG